MSESEDDVFLVKRGELEVSCQKTKTPFEIKVDVSRGFPNGHWSFFSFNVSCNKRKKRKKISSMACLFRRKIVKRVDGLSEEERSEVIQSEIVKMLKKYFSG